MAAIATKRPGTNASPKEIDAYVKQLQRERDEHTKATNGLDVEMLAIYNRLGQTMKDNGLKVTVPRSRNGVRENAGTGKILKIIAKLAKGKPPIVRTGEVAKEAHRRFKIKYPHSSFQSLKSAGAIRLSSPSRGFITLLT